MKVFVYTKTPTKKIAVITGVVSAVFDKQTKKIVLETADGVRMTFDTKTVKLTLYQN